MISRRQSRLLAAQAMYGFACHRRDADDLLAGVAEVIENPDILADGFTHDLIRATIERIDEIDARLGKIIEHWQPERVGRVDRALLRLAVAELLFFEDIPPRVTLDEYIELARELGDDESPRFINGVLDRALKPDDDPAPDPSSEPSSAVEQE